MPLLFVFLLSLILVSCSQKSTSPTSPVNPVTTGAIEEPVKKDPNQELIDAAVSDHMVSFEGYELKTLKVYHTSGRPTKVSFKNHDANSMEVSLDFLDDKKPNLRLSRIIMPDGTIDGPFWDKVGYNLTQKWEYQLLFNENQMAGEPWSGIVDINIRLLSTEYPEPAVSIP